MDTGIGIGAGFQQLPGGAGAPFAGARNVVVIGASLVEQCFGQSLVSPNARATAVFRAAGLDVDVYGYGWSGASMVATLPRIAEAFAAFPQDTLFAIHTGGNNVTGLRPYADADASALTAFADDVQALVAAVQPRAADTLIASISFRSYETAPDVAGRDDLFFDEARGSAPHNDQILIPAIAAGLPGTMNTDGRPVLDIYRATRNVYDLFLSGDGVHPSDPNGRRALRGIFAERLAWRLTGGARPAPIVPATVAGAGFTPEPWQRLVVNFGPREWEARHGFTNTVHSGQVNAGDRPLLTDLGKWTGVTLQLTHPGSAGAAFGDTIGTGLSTGLPLYDGRIRNDIVLSDSIWLASGGALGLSIGGLVPGSAYRVSALASRSSGEARVTRVDDGAGGMFEYPTSAAPVPEAPGMVLTALPDGRLDLTVSSSAGAYGYIGGLEIEAI